MHSTNREANVEFREESDEKMMLEFKEGNTASFERLVAKYERPLLNYFSRSINDKLLAEDLTQEVFLSVVKARKKYKPIAKFSTWLFAIARNQLLMEFRKKQPKILSIDSNLSSESNANTTKLKFPIADDSPLPSDEYEKTKIKNIIESEIGKLDEKFRTVILLKHFEDMTCEEISEILHIPVGTVWSRLHYATNILANKLESLKYEMR